MSFGWICRYFLPLGQRKLLVFSFFFFFFFFLPFLFLFPHYFLLLVFFLLLLLVQSTYSSFFIFFFYFYLSVSYLPRQIFLHIPFHILCPTLSSNSISSLFSFFPHSVFFFTSFICIILHLNENYPGPTDIEQVNFHLIRRLSSCYLWPTFQFNFHNALARKLNDVQNCKQAHVNLL